MRKGRRGATWRIRRRRRRGAAPWEEEGEAGQQVVRLRIVRVLLRWSRRGRLRMTTGTGRRRRQCGLGLFRSISFLVGLFCR